MIVSIVLIVIRFGGLHVTRLHNLDTKKGIVFPIELHKQICNLITVTLLNKWDYYQDYNVTII